MEAAGPSRVNVNLFVHFPGDPVMKMIAPLSVERTTEDTKVILQSALKTAGVSKGHLDSFTWKSSSAISDNLYIISARFVSDTVPPAIATLFKVRTPKVEES